jgi:hypothetical protein
MDNKKKAVKKNTTTNSKADSKTAKETIQKTGEEQQINHSQAPKVDPKDVTQEMFDEHWERYMGQLSEEADKGEAIVLAIVIDREFGHPIIMAKGHHYELAKAAAALYKQQMVKVAAELSTGPDLQTGPTPR